MSLLIKALNKAEQAQAENAKTEQAQAEKSKTKPMLALDLELGVAPANKRKIETPAEVKNTANLDMDLSLSPKVIKVADDNLKANDSVKNVPVYTPSAIQPSSGQPSASSVSAKNAANVFSAKGMEARTDSTRLALIAGAGLIALLGMGLYFYQFVDNSPPIVLPSRPLEQVDYTAQNIPSVGTAAKGTPLNTTESEQAKAIESDLPSAETLSPNEALLTAETRKKIKKAVPAEETSSKFADDTNEASEKVSNDNLAEDALNDGEDDTNRLEASFSANKVAKKTRKSKSNAVIASDSATIQVTKSTPQAGVNPILMSAYEAYNAGYDKDAIKLYKQVLQRDVRNVDALLGLGAIASRQGRSADANGWYGKVLEIDPRNSIARASMLDNQSQGNEQMNETSLKNMLAKQPDDANLYVALGNLYAEQNQWPAAQQAYFDAYSLNKTAENAYNLAVSLDQMGKPKLALPYYQRALEQASSVSNIDKAALEARIAVIQ